MDLQKEMEQLNLSTSVPTNTWNENGLATSIILALCFLVGVPGNFAVIVYLGRKPQHLTSVTRRLMLNLAVSDLLSLLTLPLWIHAELFNWVLGPVLCKLLAYLVYCCLYNSTLTITAQSIQRHIQVLFPRTWAGLGRRGEWALMGVLWLAMVTLSTPALVFGQPITFENRTSCQLDYSSNSQLVAVLLVETTLGFAVPFSIITTNYVCLHRRVNQSVFFTSSKLTKLLTMIILTFFFLWTPYHIINVLVVGTLSMNTKSLFESVLKKQKYFGALVFINSCVNPILYVAAARNSPRQMHMIPT